MSSLLSPTMAARQFADKGHSYCVAETIRSHVLAFTMTTKSTLPLAVPNTCCSGTDSCAEPSAVGRRSFIQAGSMAAAMLLAGRSSIMAGPFEETDFDEIIPADKKLSQSWIDSLYARGKPMTATGDDLKYIGMPINGICTGQVYLGGDGQLWLWNLDASRDFKKNTAKGPRFMDPDVAPGLSEKAAIKQEGMSQGFALQVSSEPDESSDSAKVFTLDAKGFSDVTFTNQYPMATVDYADADCPVEVHLQAYTPFIPLNRDDSSYPVIVMRYTVENTSSIPQEIAIAGWVENISNTKSGKAANGKRVCVYHELDGISTVECAADFRDRGVGSAGEPQVEVFADFEGGTYGEWTVEGKAFGGAPSDGVDESKLQKLSGFQGKGLVNSWTGTDALQGKLISPEFMIQKSFINFLIGGGSDAKQLTVSLWVDGKPVRSATGKKSDAMKWTSWSVDEFQGKVAHLEILDASSGAWGHIDVDQIEFSTHPPAKTEGNSPAEMQPDFGSIALGVMGDARPEIVDIDRSRAGVTDLFTDRPDDLKSGSHGERALKERSFASLGRKLTLQPGESQTVSFTLSWRFPNVKHAPVFGRPNAHAINHYSTLWSTAADSANSVAARSSELHQTTQTWTDTWYDSTLPYWFLERTFVTLDCVQTQMGQRFAKGKDPEHYNFEEGVKCCPGNCTHVWHYAQGLSRIFPQIERECRDKIEYGLGFDPKSGSMRHRYTGAKFGDAIDGNCGTILRVLRESQMTPDYTFLKGIWERTKLSMDHVIQKWDPDEDGMLEGAQHNTLDEPWFGQVHWLINLYHAALKASAVMARQMNQPSVAARYEAIVSKGAPAMVDLLWSEDFGYFIHKPGPSEDQKHGSTNGCHIDQLLGDSWLWNVGIERILPQEKILESLQSLWKYNFAPDVGPFREKVTEGRWYAAAGNAGLVMCTFPNGKIEPKSGKKNYAGYLNECMTGFEWQVAAHMIWEGMLEKGLAIGKAIHDRYLPEDRNPYNEIECSDHYSRAMASFGAYLAICGYQYDGPQGKLAFAPKLGPEKFRAAFTTAQGWGQFSQELVNGQQTAAIELRYGKLALQELTLDRLPSTPANQAVVKIDGKAIEASHVQSGNRHVLSFAGGLELVPGQRLDIQFA
ncbi:GH116 family glycosyl-hydrolase [Neorhodopirellula lusitana]|uniref:GH116 family glycosyl-hydrolase n=1 Tax=Neorhodopirellula lusitana TaxID=445327 RepID=UPI003850F3A3